MKLIVCKHVEYYAIYTEIKEIEPDIALSLNRFTSLFTSFNPRAFNNGKLFPGVATASSKALLRQRISSAYFAVNFHER